jgi:hypothetical protein
MCDCLQKRARQFETEFEGVEFIDPKKPYELMLGGTLQVFETINEMRPNPAVFRWQSFAPDYCPWCGERIDSCREALKVQKSSYV